MRRLLVLVAALIPVALFALVLGQRSEAGVSIREGRLRLTMEGLQGVAVSYFFPMDVDSLAWESWARRVDGAALCVADSGMAEAQGGCDPELIILWKGDLGLFIQALPSDTLSFVVRDLAAYEKLEEGWIMAPGLSDSIRAAAGWNEFSPRGKPAITRIDLRGFEEGECVLEGREILAPLEEGFWQNQAECPTKCPFWCPVRITTEAGVIYGLLAADACPLGLFTWGDPEMDAAWAGDRERFMAIVHGRAQERWMPQATYDAFVEAARARGVKAIVGDEE